MSSKDIIKTIKKLFKALEGILILETIVQFIIIVWIIALLDKKLDLSSIINNWFIIVFVIIFYFGPSLKKLITNLSLGSKVKITLFNTEIQIERSELIDIIERDNYDTLEENQETFLLELKKKGTFYRKSEQEVSTNDGKKVTFYIEKNNDKLIISYKKDSHEELSYEHDLRPLRNAGLIRTENNKPLSKCQEIRISSLGKLFVTAYFDRSSD